MAGWGSFRNSEGRSQDGPNLMSFENLAAEIFIFETPFFLITSDSVKDLRIDLDISNWDQLN